MIQSLLIKNLKKYELTDHNKFIIRFKDFPQIDEIIKNKSKNKFTDSEIERLNLKSNYEYLKINTFPSEKIVNFLSEIPNVKSTRYKKFPLWKMIIKKTYLSYDFLVHLQNWTYRFNTTIYFSRKIYSFKKRFQTIIFKLL